MTVYSYPKKPKLIPTLGLKRIVISKINLLIYEYMNQFDVETIHLKYRINEIDLVITHYKIKKYIDWYVKSGVELLEIYRCLKNKDFYGMCRLTNGQLVKVTPKK